MQDYDIEISLTHNEAKPVVPELFIKTLKDNNKKNVLKNMHFNKFSGIVDAYNNTIHSATKMKPGNVISTLIIIIIQENPSLRLVIK